MARFLLGVPSFMREGSESRGLWTEEGDTPPDGSDLRPRSTSKNRANSRPKDGRPPPAQTHSTLIPI